MNLTSVGAPLATRRLELDGEPSVEVVLGMPQPFPDGRDFFCPFQFRGMADGKIRYGAGVDEFQALILTLQAIGTLLETSDEGRAGRLSWLGEAGALGFPTIPVTP